MRRLFDFGIENQDCPFELVALNDQFIFIECYDLYDDDDDDDDEKEGIVKKIFLLNRHDNNNLFKHFKSDMGDWIIYNNQIGCITDRFFEIFEMDGPRKPISFKSKIKQMFITSNCKCVYIKTFDFINLIVGFVFY